MKAKHRPWTPAQHRRYIETQGPHLPAILKFLGFLVLAIGAAISLTTNNAEDASWGHQTPDMAKKLPALSEALRIKRVYSNRAT